MERHSKVSLRSGVSMKIIGDARTVVKRKSVVPAAPYRIRVVYAACSPPGGSVPLLLGTKGTLCSLCHVEKALPV